jgi:hypothetical protein
MSEVLIFTGFFKGAPPGNPFQGFADMSSEDTLRIP